MFVGELDVIGRYMLALVVIALEDVALIACRFWSIQSTRNRYNHIPPQCVTESLLNLTAIPIG